MPDGAVKNRKEGDVLYCMQKGEAFLASPAVQAALAREQAKGCEAHCSYVLEGQVPADLEAIFCRGAEWESGVEHVLLLQVNSRTICPRPSAASQQPALAPHTCLCSLHRRSMAVDFAQRPAFV